MNVTVVSAEKKENFSVTALECQTPYGNLTILEGHAPELILLKKNSCISLVATKTEKTDCPVTNQGMIEILRDHVLVILT